MEHWEMEWAGMGKAAMDKARMAGRGMAPSRADTKRGCAREVREEMRELRRAWEQ